MGDFLVVFKSPGFCFYSDVDTMDASSFEGGSIDDTFMEISDANGSGTCIFVWSLEIMDDMKGYLKNIQDSVQTISNGMKLTFRQLWKAQDSRKPVGIEEDSYFEQKEGIMTLQYPYESLPVPDNARYRLHNEIEDCIVCDKCAKICPVDCIEIEPIKSPEVYGKTSDGTPKRIHAARFDIDMAKCCFCGLCTTVCPTECLTMTKAYDFPEFDVDDHTYAFAELTPLEILEKRKKEEEMEKARQANKATGKKTEDPSKEKPVSGEVRPASGKKKPVFKPRPMTRKKPPKSDE